MVHTDTDLNPMTVGGRLLLAACSVHVNVAYAFRARLCVNRESDNAECMKTMFQVYTDATMQERVKELAQEVDAPIGDVLALVASYGLDRIKKDALIAWAQTLPARKGRIGNNMTKVERTALAGLQLLTKEGFEKDGISFRFCVDDIAHKVGLRIAVAQDALAALQMRGLVGSVAMSGDGPEPDYDAWGRAKGTVWWTVEAHAAWKLAKGIKG
jgi:hypothetical protein